MHRCNVFSFTHVVVIMPMATISFGTLTHRNKGICKVHIRGYDLSCGKHCKQLIDCNLIKQNSSLYQLILIGDATDKVASLAPIQGLHMISWRGGMLLHSAMISISSRSQHERAFDSRVNIEAADSSIAWRLCMVAQGLQG